MKNPSCRCLSVFFPLALFIAVRFCVGQEAQSLDQVLGQVVEANLRLQVQKLDQDMAEERAKAEWAIFEPVLLLTLASEANERQNTTEQFLSQRVSVFDEQNEIYSAAVEGTLPTGGRLRIGSQMRALDNNLQVTGREEWENFTGVTLTQPLMRDMGWKSVAAQIRLATADSAVALQDYRGQLALVLSEAEMAYWELAAATAFVEMSQRSLNTAETILADNRDRLAAGKTTELEVLQAEAGQAMRRSNLDDARQRRLDAAARLNAFLGRRAGDGSSINPAESLQTESVPVVTSVAIGESFESHPIYLAQTERLKQAGIRLAYSKNERLPQLDLKASYGLNGLGATWKGSLDDVQHGDFPSWYLGLEVRAPLLFGKRERHQLAAAKMRVEQALLQLSAIEVELENSIHVLVKKVDSLTARVGALQQVVELQERVLESERESLEVGKSNSRSVLEIEEDVSEARLEAIAAGLELRKALVDLMVQRGVYLRERGFEIDDQGEA